MLNCGNEVGITGPLGFIPAGVDLFKLLGIVDIGRFVPIGSFLLYLPAQNVNNGIHLPSGYTWHGNMYEDGTRWLKA